MARQYCGVYEGRNLDRVAFPLGGIGAGMLCIEGSGAFSHVSLRNRPGIHNAPCMFSALCVKGRPNTARVLEGPVPKWKYFGAPGTGNGGGGTSYGLPRFAKAEFAARFPFADIKLTDDAVPVSASVTAWSPFVPNDADSTSLPVGAVEYTFANRGKTPVEAMYSFSAANFMRLRDTGHGVVPADHGFTLLQNGSTEAPWEQGAFCASVDEPKAETSG